MSLALTGVSLRLAGRRLFQPLELTVAPGEVVTVMGPSGSGKSSLLAHLTGALPPVFVAEGRAVLFERPLDGLPPERRRIGILFQDDLLFPHLTVAQNLAFGLPRRVKGRQDAVERALASAELDGLGPRDPGTLSGGQRARVALLRALLAEPQALLLDEPFAKLDIALRGRFRQVVFAAVADRGIPALLVTHDPADAPGRIVQLDPP